MTAEEHNSCWKCHIVAIRQWQIQWQNDEERTMKCLKLMNRYLVDAKEVLANVDKNNPKALRSATGTVDIFENHVARMEEELKDLRARIAKGHAEIQQYHERIVGITT